MRKWLGILVAVAAMCAGIACRCAPEEIEPRRRAVSSPPTPPILDILGRGQPVETFAELPDDVRLRLGSMLGPVAERGEPYARGDVMVADDRPRHGFMRAGSNGPHWLVLTGSGGETTHTNMFTFTRDADGWLRLGGYLDAPGVGVEFDNELLVNILTKHQDLVIDRIEEALWGFRHRALTGVPIDESRTQFRDACLSGKDARGVAGRVVVDWTIAGDGAVRNARVRESTLGRPEVEACLLRELGKLEQWKQHSKRHEEKRGKPPNDTEASYPFFFTPW